MELSVTLEFTRRMNSAAINSDAMHETPLRQRIYLGFTLTWLAKLASIRHPPQLNAWALAYNDLLGHTYVLCI